MPTLLNIALINAVTVLPLALLAFAVSRFARRPALSHAVWVLVLLKFVAPPLFSLPVTIDVPVATVGQVSNVPLTKRDAVTFDNSLLASAPANQSEIMPADLPPIEVAPPARVRRDRPSFLASALQTCSAFWTRRPDVRSMLFGLWLVVSGLWLSLQIVRSVRFHRRVLRDANTNAELQQQTNQLANALRLRRVPQVLIVDAAVSPMLWGCGSRAKLLFPVDLAARLDVSARATLITHELAHFARGDHWVRLLELIATGLFWWHPVVWLAKQQIEAAEEECCDAWVVDQFPNTPKLYAEALLDTIDYLCERRQALPPVACGLGQASFLRRRLTKIMRGASPKAMSRQVRFATAVVAALLLPLQPFVFGSASISNLVPTAMSPGESAVDVERSEVRGPKSDAANSELPPEESSTLPKVTPSSASRQLRGEKTWSTAASADGRFVIRATTARRVMLTDRFTNVEADLSSHSITAVAFVPDRHSFVAVGSDGRVTLWDAVQVERSRVLFANGDAWRSVSVSPTGDAVAVGGKDGSVLVLDLALGAMRLELPRQAMAVNCVRFSPDGKKLAVAIGNWDSDARGQVVLFDVQSKSAEAVLECDSAVGAITFASDGDVIVGLWNGRADLWNLESLRLVGSAQANKAVVAAASFSPDNPALREVDFVATQPIATKDKSENALLDFFFGGRRP